MFKIILFLLCFGGLYYLCIVGAGLLTKPEMADIAVVLGNEVLANGEPSLRLAARLDCAIALYQQKKIRLVVVSGGKSIRGQDEATAMAKYLVRHSIPEADIISDSLGVNTMATAVNTAQLMQKEKFTRVIIVTQYFHVLRTELAFYMAGIRNFSADHPDYFELRDIPSTLREMVAIPVYWFTKPYSH